MKEEYIKTLGLPDFERVPGDGGLSGGSTNFKNEQNYASAESGGNPSVNLAIGRLRYEFSDLSIGNGNYLVGIAHIYNSLRNQSLNDKATNVGEGWKLNIQQYLVVDSSDSSVVKFIDGKGEIHRFYNFDTNYYYDENNAQNVLYYSSTSKYITDSFGNKLIFDVTNGYLVRIESYHSKPIIKQFVYIAVNLLKGTICCKKSIYCPFYYFFIL